jgi:hypothetical protein
VGWAKAMEGPKGDAMKKRLQKIVKKTETVGILTLNVRSMVDTTRRQHLYEKLATKRHTTEGILRHVCM